MQREVTIIVGQTGTGKSLWAKLCTRLLTKGFFYDPSMSFPNVQWLGEDELLELTDEKELLESDDYDFGETYRLGTPYPSCLDTLSDYAFVTGETNLIVEECHTVFTRGQLLDDWATRQIFYGRHQGVNSYWISQRAASLPIDIRSQVNRVISFRQIESADVDWLAPFFGKKESREYMPRLENLVCLDHIVGTGTTRYSIEPQVRKLLGITIQKSQPSMIDRRSLKDDSEDALDDA